MGGCDHCKRPGCENPVPYREKGRGRRREFCQKGCKRLYEKEVFREGAKAMRLKHNEPMPNGRMAPVQLDRQQPARGEKHPSRISGLPVPSFKVHLLSIGRALRFQVALVHEQDLDLFHAVRPHAWYPASFRVEPDGAGGAER